MATFGITPTLKSKLVWEYLKECNYSENLLIVLENNLITQEEKQQRENEKDVNENNVEDSLFLINQIQKLGLKFWTGFQKYIENNKIETIDYYLVWDLVKKIKNNKNLSSRDIVVGKKTMDFIELNPNLFYEIKKLSSVEEKEIVELKFVYDKLLLIPKVEWQRIFDLSIQTKIFDNLELANVRSVYNTLIKKENIKEQSLLKAYESLKKLKKFGIKI